MSYDISIIHKKTRQVIIPSNILPSSIKCNIRQYGGTVQIDSNGNICYVTEFKFNITYNYSHFYYKYMDSKEGIRCIYNKKLNSVIKIIDSFIKKIGSTYATVLNKIVVKYDLQKNKWVFVNIHDAEKFEDTYDYWDITPYNVIKSVDHIKRCILWLKENYNSKDYNNMIITGD